MYIPAHFTAWLIALRFYQLKVSISHSNQVLYMHRVRRYVLEGNNRLPLAPGKLLANC